MTTAESARAALANIAAAMREAAESGEEYSESELRDIAAIVAEMEEKAKETGTND